MNDFMRIVRKNTLLLPMIAIVAIVPLLLRGRIRSFTQSELLVYPSEKLDYPDFFLVFKNEVFLIVVAFALIGLLIQYVYRKDWRIDKIAALSLLVYMGCAVFSGLFGGFKDLAFSGGVDRHEPVIIHIAYAVTALIFYKGIRARSELENVLIPVLSVSAIVIAVIALPQAFGITIFNTPIGNALLLPQGMEITAKNYGIFSASGVFSTLNNPDFLSHYMGVVSAIMLAIITFNGNKKLAPMTYILTVFALVATNAVGGMIGFFAGANAILLLNRGTDFVKRKFVLYILWPLVVLGLLYVLPIQIPVPLDVVAILVLGVAGTLAHLELKGYVNKRDKISVYRNAVMAALAISAVAVFAFVFIFKDAPGPYKNVSIENGNLSFLMENGTNIVFVNKGDKTVDVTESNGKHVEIKPVGDMNELSVEQKILFKYQVKQLNQFSVLYFMPDMKYFMKDGRFYLVDTRLKSGEISCPPSYGFVGNEEFGSGRGFIWSRSLPLLMDSLLLGSGPDTYMVRFPQNDITAKLNIGVPNLIVDKPHNWYLQLGINLGVPAMLAMLILYFRIGRSVWKDRCVNPYTLACFGGITAYYAGGIFYDSISSVAPVFWALLGMTLFLINDDKKVI